MYDKLLAWLHEWGGRLLRASSERYQYVKFSNFMAGSDRSLHHHVSIVHVVFLMRCEDRLLARGQCTKRCRPPFPYVSDVSTALM